MDSMMQLIDQNRFTRSLSGSQMPAILQEWEGEAFKESVAHDGEQ